MNNIIQPLIKILIICLFGMQICFAQRGPQDTWYERARVAMPSGCSPHDLIVTPEGTLLLSDGGNHKIHELDENGSLIRSFGLQGTGNGRFNSPIEIAIGPGNRIYVADTNGNNRACVNGIKNNKPLHEFFREIQGRLFLIVPTAEFKLEDQQHWKNQLDEKDHPFLEAQIGHILYRGRFLEQTYFDPHTFDRFKVSTNCFLGKDDAKMWNSIKNTISEVTLCML